MLSSEMRARLTVVLVGARNPSNIGATARAMHDFGFDNLRVVNEYAPPFEAAQIQNEANVADGSAAAVGATHVLRNARRFDCLGDAIAESTLVIGTTAIGARQISRPVHRLSEATEQIREALASGGAALLFGSEKTGLTNEQLSHCGMLITIPMFAPDQARYLSMNLGQAVAVCLYELVRSGFEGARELPYTHEEQPTSAARERLTHLLLEAMTASGYAKRFPANSREHVVRQLAQQLGSTQTDTSRWMGFLRQVIRGTKKNAPS